MGSDDDTAAEQGRSLDTPDLDAQRSPGAENRQRFVNRSTHRVGDTVAIAHS